MITVAIYEHFEKSKIVKAINRLKHQKQLLNKL